MPSTPRTRSRRTLVRSLGVASILVIMAVVAACSSAAAPVSRSLAGVGPAGPADAGAGIAVPAVGPGEVPAAGAAATAAPADAVANGGTGTGAGATSPGVVTNTTYIVRTGSLTMEVPVVRDALLRARTAILGLGGYISGSVESNSSDRAMASVTYRIPADRWENALDALRGIATKVDDLKTDSTEVTGQVLDLGARLDNLRVTESALQAIMAKATKIQDILDVQNQLTAVQGQIEELSTQQAHLKDQAAMSSLTVLFQAPPPAAVKETSKGWDPGAEFDRAAAQLLGLGQGLATVAIWIAVVCLPILFGLLVVLLVLAFLVRRIPWRSSSPVGPAGPPDQAGPPAPAGAV